MKKRIISLLLSVLMLISLIPISSVFAAGTTNIVISADKTTAYPDDIVNFTVSIGAVKHLMGAEFKVTIPTGITYVAGSTSVADGLKTTLGCASANWTESSMKFTMYGDGDYSSDSNTKILTFSCRIDSNTIGSIAPQITDIVLSDTGFEEITTQVDDNSGTVTVAQRPVSVTGISLNKNELSLTAGGSEVLVATVTPENASNKAVSWISLDPSVATVDSNGTVEALKKGTTTITVATSDGGFTDVCLVTVACAHSNSTTHSAIASTCLVQGNEKYITCNDCGELLSGTDEKLPLSGHVGGTETCKDKAICTVCNQSYGNYGNHTLTKHNAVSADHSQGGNIEYWTCDVCGKFFSDSVGIDEITKEDTKTNKVPHNYSSTYLHNDIQHWYECACGDKVGVEEHNYDNACDADCNTCNYLRVITHDYSTKWYSDGTNHWYECEVCHDKTGVATHFGGTATCTAKATCTECNISYGDKLAHDNIEMIEEKYLKSEATCISKAVYYKSCSVCGTTDLEMFEFGEIDTTNHTGENEVKDTAEATCTSDGYSGDVYCKDCGEKLEDGKIIPAGHDYGTTYKTDNKNHWKECACGDAIEKAAHTLSKWIVTKEASTTEKGSKERTCSVCEYKEVEEISPVKAESPKTGDYGNAYLWIILLAVSSLGFVGVIVRKKRI